MITWSSSKVIAQISQTISEACRIRTQDSAPGDFVYFWYDNGGNIRYSSVPLTSTERHPPSVEIHHNVFLHGEVGFCFVPNNFDLSNDTFSSMVLKEALIGRQVINDKVYLTVGDVVRNQEFSWNTWQDMGIDSVDGQLRHLNAILRGVVISETSSIIDYRDSLVFAEEYGGDEIKRTVDVVRWRNTGEIESVQWYHSPRDRANAFESKVLEVFVVQQLSPSELPRTFVIRFKAEQENG